MLYSILIIAAVIFASLASMSIFMGPAPARVSLTDHQASSETHMAAQPEGGTVFQDENKVSGKKETPDRPEFGSDTMLLSKQQARTETEVDQGEANKEVSDGIDKDLSTEGSRDEPVEGELFVTALIKVLDDEINKTTFGWRPNSLLFGKFHLTDNVNNRQLGVLETVRTVSWVLKEKISRYGDADAFNPYLENAVNYFMNSAFQFWFPSADSQFRQGLKELGKYLEYLKSGQAHFYPRSDNFEAVIEACKELVGNCHHNLVKKRESNGKKVSMWKTDDYFYYAKGVALAMSQILAASVVDFEEELELVRGTQLLKEVVANLYEASQLDPFIVLNGSLDGLRANHRANMAVPMGEALFKLSNLLKY